MSNIDEVIARARQPGGFSEQQQFTVARERAIRKMREFALADPHFYILELIQAAVANNADHVHIEVDQTELQFSYIGGGYAREELAQLFDFLFASKEDFEHADIRQLAVGINALMIMEPSRIIVESGQGTLQSTDRIEIREQDNTVEVGTPEQPLRGTFIRAEGLDRGLIRDKSSLSARSYGPPECTAIEERCLAAPVPIIVNSEPVFGYTSRRTPVVFGYDDVVTFDEGDLYGSIGIPEHRHKESFKVMTWGVWIESTESARMDETKIGGVICYDRLNKTADHSGIVRDERFEEMWARIRPYARQSVEGRSGKGSYRIKHLSGADIPSGNLRDFFRNGDTFVVVDISISPDQQEGQLARNIGDALDAPVLCVAEDAFQSVEVLAGADSELLRPNLDAPGDLEFYRRPRAAEPGRPWLTGEVDLEPIEIEQLADAIVAEETVAEQQKDQFIEWFRSRVPVRGAVYTPRDAGQTRELYVRVRTLGRVVWEGPVRHPFPGHVLDVDLPAVPPSHLLQAATDETSFAEIVARVAARQVMDELQTATQRALKNLAMHGDTVPSDTGRRIALAALGRSALKRLRRKSEPDGRPTIHFSLVRPQPGPDLLDLQVFQAVDGTRYSLRQLEELMDETAGLVYGVVPEVEPALEGLDRSRILDLDLERERQLMTIVGDAAYVRVDRRDLLAETGPFQVRDMAVGLKSYPDFPLLVEGGDPSTLDADRREEVVADLVDQLKTSYGDPQLEPSVRREAVRHLQWFVSERAAGEADRPTYEVETLPLFLDGEGKPASFRQVMRGLETTGALEMIDGRSSDVCELGSLTDSSAPSDRPVQRLTMNTWVFRLLSKHGPVRSAFDFDFSDREAEELEATPSDAFLEQRSIDTDGLDGRVGVPVEPVDTPSIAIVEPDRTRAYRMRQPAIGAGLTGFVHVQQGSVKENWDEIRSVVTKKRTDILNSLLERITELDRNSRAFERGLETLFNFAARHLQFSRNPDGSVTPHVEHPLAERILDLPLIPTEAGNPVSAHRLVHEFCRAESSGRPAPSLARPSELPEPIAQWVERHLTASNIIEPPDEPVSTVPQPSPSADLSVRLSSWLLKLRPDDPDRALTHSPETSSASSESDDSDSLTIRVADPDEFSNVNFGNGVLCRYVSWIPALVVDAQHPIAVRASDPDNPEAFAWLLLACYAHLNDLLEPVTNDHELEFQRRVADTIDEF